jgi:hypothetical protein
MEAEGEERGEGAWICKRLRSTGIDSKFQRINSASLCSPAPVRQIWGGPRRGRYDNPVCRTGPPGYIGWRNRFQRRTIANNGFLIKED